MSEEKKPFASDGVYLSVEGQERILSAWNSRPDNRPPSLKRMVSEAFPDAPEELKDGRSKYGKCVKAFLSTLDLEARPAQKYQAKGLIDLSEEQKERITELSTLPIKDIVKDIFPNEASHSALSQEYRTIKTFVESLPVEILSPPTPVIGEYEPPNTFDKTLNKVNSYIHEKIDKKKISNKQSNELNSIQGYMNTVRFVHQINSYETTDQRSLFESSFVRYTHDKGDLTQEEVDQYIVLSTEVVISTTIQRTISAIQAQIDAELENSSRVPMALVEAGNTARTEYNQCVTRQQKLLSDLKVKRSDRLSKQVKANASILNLVELWRDKESREKLVKLAELRKKALREEVENLGSMDEVKARIMGLSENEVLNG